MKEVKKVKTTRYERVPGGGLRRLPDSECIEVRDSDTGAVTNYRNMDDYHAGITARMLCENPEMAEAIEKTHSGGGGIAERAIIKAEGYDASLCSDTGLADHIRKYAAKAGGITVTQLAHILSEHGFEAGRNTLYARLAEDGLLIETDSGYVPASPEVGSVKTVNLCDYGYRSRGVYRYDHDIPLLDGEFAAAFVNGLIDETI